MLDTSTVLVYNVYMPKITLDSVTSGYASNTLLNANFSAIEAALENTVSRDGTTPNNLTADLDMNSNLLINLGTPISELDAATKGYVDTKVSVATGIAVTELANLRIWDFSDVVSMADPGTGTFRLNNTTPNLATAAAISATSGDAGNPDLSDWIASWDASSNGVKGQLILTDTSDPNNVIIFYITGSVTDNSTWLQMTLTNVEQSGSMTDGTTYHVTFTRAGDVGSATVSDGDKGDITVSGGGLAWDIDAGAVGTTELADDAVTTDKITNDAVTTDKIADANVTAAKLADTYVETNTTGITGADAVTNIVSLTTAEYTAATKDASTLYIITDA